MVLNPVTSLIGVWAELRRRKILHAIGVCAILAWVVLQLARHLLPPLLADWAVTAVVILVILGTPVALVLAGAVHFAPAGEARHVRLRTRKRPIPSYLDQTAPPAAQPPPVSEPDAPQAQRESVDPDAYQLYLEARQLLSERSEAGLRRAQQLFEQAIAQSPTFARAYAGLAECHIIRGDHHYVAPQKAFPRAKVAALRALDLDPKLAEPYATLGLTRLLYEWNWADAEWDLRRAIELDAGCGMAYHWLWAYLAVMGRLEEARAAIEQAQHLDTLSRIISSNLGRHYYYARQYDRAIEQCRKSLDLYPDAAVAHFFLGQTYVEKGMYSEAIAELEEAVTLSGRRPPRVAGLARACALAGRRQEALALLRELNARSARQYVSPVYLALVHLGLDEPDRAFDWLRRAYRQRSSELVWLRVDPKIDPVRDDPRFTRLLMKMNLAAEPAHGSPEPDSAAG